MNARDVARAARRSIEIAHERLRLGDALLVFAEGTRSRTGGMQPLLAGAARYCEMPGTWLLPVGITGSDAMFPIGEDGLYPVRVNARLGAPIDAAALHQRVGGDRRVMMDHLGFAIAELLPPEYRGAYADDDRR
jgi:1-acyl-sn-glycerol-3-phosphate acyltransferase